MKGAIFLPKKLFLTFFFIIVAVAAFLYIDNNGSEQASTNDTDEMSLLEKIQYFPNPTKYHIEDEEKIESIELEKDLDSDHRAVLFDKKNGDIGYAFLKNDKVITTTYGDSKQHEGLDGDYLILYGEKPSEDITKLKVKISLGNNYQDVDKTFDLTDDKYYLVFHKLPEKDLFAHVKGDYIFE